MAEIVSTKQPEAIMRRIDRASVFRGQFMKTRWCCFFKLQGRCKHGSGCHFAHSAEELSAPPDLRKTSLCKQWFEGSCPNMDGSCNFAHGQAELKITPAIKGNGKDDEEKAPEAAKATAEEILDQVPISQLNNQASMLATPESAAVCDKMMKRKISFENDEISFENDETNDEPSDGSSFGSPRSFSDLSEVTQGSPNSGSDGVSESSYGTTSLPVGRSPWETYGNRSAGMGYPPSSICAGATNGSGQILSTAPPTSYVSSAGRRGVGYATPNYGGVNSGDTSPNRRHSWSDGSMTSSPPQCFLSVGPRSVARSVDFTTPTHSGVNSGDHVPNRRHSWSDGAIISPPPGNFLAVGPRSVDVATPNQGGANSGDTLPNRRQSWPGGLSHISMQAAYPPQEKQQFPVQMPPMPAPRSYLSSPGGSGDVARDNAQATGHAATQSGGPAHFYLVGPVFCSGGAMPREDLLGGDEVAEMLAAAAPEHYED